MPQLACQITAFTWGENVQQTGNKRGNVLNIENNIVLFDCILNILYVPISSILCEHQPASSLSTNISSKSFQLGFPSTLPHPAPPHPTRPRSKDVAASEGQALFSVRRLFWARDLALTMLPDSPEGSGLIWPLQSWGELNTVWYILSVFSEHTVSSCIFPRFLLMCNIFQALLLHLLLSSKPSLLCFPAFKQVIIKTRPPVGPIES